MNNQLYLECPHFNFLESNYNLQEGYFKFRIEVNTKMGRAYAIWPDKTKNKIMNYNPAIHHRRSIRLKGYDYSQKGMYFITICVQNRDYLFGRIVIDVGADLRVCPNIELPLGKNKQDEKGEKDLYRCSCHRR